MEQKGRERRQSPRFGVSLRCAVSLPAEDEDLLFPQARLEGRTRDVSESGLGVVLDSIYLGFACVVDEGRALRLVLSLPSGTVEMQATPAHYIRLDERGEQTSYLVGLRITSAAEADRARYAEYLSTLDKSEQV
ncbi:MAG TPA: PilZ domain-containing protein [Pyrinomonadaceae bacterium]